MTLTIKTVCSQFVGEIVDCELRRASDPCIFNELTQALNVFPVLISRNQPFDDAEQIQFAERLSGQRGHIFFSRMSNIDEGNRILEAGEGTQETSESL